MINLGDQLLDTAEGPATNSLLRDPTEPELHLIEPGGVRWRVVDVIAGPQAQPGTDLRMFMRGIVIDDEMDRQVARHTGVDVAQEREKLLMAMPSPALADDRSGSHIQGGEQRRSAVTDIVMRDALHIAEPQGKDGLRTIQRLDLSFLIHTQHERLIRRVEIEADDVTHLLHKEGIGGELEGALSMRLEPKRQPDAMDHGFGDPGGLRHRPTAPVRAGRGLRAECLGDQGSNRLVATRARPPGPKLIMEAGQAITEESVTPLAHRRLRDAELLGNRRIAQAFMRQQDHTGASPEAVRDRARSEEALQLSHFVRRQRQGRFGSAGLHVGTSLYEMCTEDARHMPAIYGTLH